MFLELLSSENAGPAALLVSAGIISYIGYQRYIQKQKDIKATKAIQQWETHVLQIYYPLCSQKIALIYEAAGLVPLIVKLLDYTPSRDTLSIVNKIVQDVLSKSDNDSSLESIKARLERAYTEAYLTITPVINLSRLIELFSQPLNLDNPMPNSKTSISKIAEARTHISTYIKTHTHKPDTFIVNCLDLLAKELNEVHRVFEKRVFLNDKNLGPVEIVGASTPKHA